MIKQLFCRLKPKLSLFDFGHRYYHVEGEYFIICRYCHHRIQISRLDKNDSAIFAYKFDKYIKNHKPIAHNWKTYSDILATTANDLSYTISSPKKV